MAKEHWYLLGTMLVVVLPLLLLVAVKKTHLLDTRPDQKIVYKVIGNQELTLHFFEAKNIDKNSPAPAILFFHGGGWLYGTPEAFYPQCQFLSEQGYSCFSAQYRLGTDNQPDIRGAVEDARSALHYLIDHAGDLHIDRQNIVAGGGSSGGHLAAALGSALVLTPADEFPRAEQRPTALVLYNPILDFSPGTLSHSLAPDDWQDISPIHHIDNAMPPALILLGSQDPEVPVATVEAYRDAVQNAGGHCEIALYEGQGHGFFNQQEYLEKTNLRVLQFLSGL